MRSDFLWQVRQLLFSGGLIAMLPVSGALGVTNTITFQNGANGYAGTVERVIDERGGDTEFDGATRPHYFLDGFQADPASPDTQSLMRFDNIFGAGPNQIPDGATILDARLQLRTATVNNADSPGPWGVGALLQPFDSSTSYFGTFNCGGCDLVSRGAWWEDGYATRPLAGFKGLVQGDVDSVDVRPLVQRWADGDPNHGFVIQTGSPTGTANGWAIQSTGNPFVDYRPGLSVTYTTDPVTVSTFQRGLDGYMDDTMAWVQSGLNLIGTPDEADPSVDDTTSDGLTLTEPAFLDGPQFTDTLGNANSEDALTLIKFGDVFGESAGQAPADLPVAGAWLAISSGDTSGNARSSGNWAAYPVLREWDTTSLYSSFGDVPGLQVFDGDLGPALDDKEALVHGAEVWFEVTELLEGIRGGIADNGLAIRSTGTADGWQIHFNGSDMQELRPRLVIASSMAAISTETPGDFNDDGVVNAADYTLWRDNLGTDFDLNGNGDETGPSAGVVDQADYDLWNSNFGNVAGGPLGTAVPEPTTSVLGIFVGIMLAGAGIRRR